MKYVQCVNPSVINLGDSVGSLWTLAEFRKKVTKGYKDYNADGSFITEASFQLMASSERWGYRLIDINQRHTVTVNNVRYHDCKVPLGYIDGYWWVELKGAVEIVNMGYINRGSGRNMYLLTYSDGKSQRKAYLPTGLKVPMFSYNNKSWILESWVLRNKI